MGKIFFRKNNESEFSKKINNAKTTIGNQYVILAMKFVNIKVKYYIGNINDDFIHLTRNSLYDNLLDWTEEIKTYMKNKFPNEVLVHGDALELNVKDMIDNLSNPVVDLIRKPQLPLVIDIIDCTCKANFEIENGIVVNIENITDLPGFPDNLANLNFKQLFVGATVEQARDLLKLMRLLPYKNNLEKVVSEYSDNIILHNLFLNAVICRLLSIVESPMDVKRARLFADSFGVEFDFSPYDIFEDETILRKGFNA